MLPVAPASAFRSSVCVISVVSQCSISRCLQATPEAKSFIRYLHVQVAATGSDAKAASREALAASAHLHPGSVCETCNPKNTRYILFCSFVSCSFCLHTLPVDGGACLCDHGFVFHRFPSNYVSTTKYNVLTFLPLVGLSSTLIMLIHYLQNLIEQFRKKANFYFLIVAILSCTKLSVFIISHPDTQTDIHRHARTVFPTLSPKTPIVSVSPLVFVLLVSAIKEAVEDYVCVCACPCVFAL